MIVAPRDGPYAEGRMQEGYEKGGGRVWGSTKSFKASWLS